MSCSDLCTAAKCAELEARIADLEQSLELLFASFNTHTNQSIPEAHQYQPQVNVNTNITENGELITEVTIDLVSDSSVLILPDSVTPSVTMDIFNPNSGEYVFKVGVNGQFDEDTLIIEPPEIDLTMGLTSLNEIEASLQYGDNFYTDSTPLPNLDVSVGVFETNQNEFAIAVQVGESRDEDYFYLPQPELNPDSNTDSNNHIPSNLAISSSFRNDILTITVADGESQDTAQVTIPIPETNDHVKSNLAISSSFRDDILTITVADGESQDSAQVTIPRLELESPIDNHIKSNLAISSSFRDDILTITVADGESEDSTQVTIETLMNCDELERKIDNCCDLLSNKIDNSISIIVAEIEETENNLKNEIDSTENIINNNLRDVTDKVEIIDAAVTVEISGTVNTRYSCKFPETDDAVPVPIPGYAQSDAEASDYSGVGLIGIHENLKLINANLDSIHNQACKGIDPVSKLTTDDLYRFCNNSDIERDDFPQGIAGNKQYTEAIQAYLTDLIRDTKYGYLLRFLNSKDPDTGNLLIKAPNNWITPMLADFALHQARINSATVCNIKDTEPGDVVAIVASDKVLDRATGKFLVLHLVTFENYPKRSRNSTYWQVQIPEAKETYDWNEDFKDLVWNRGNLYAEMYFDDIKDPVSGFFADKESANSWFNSILDLTTATERNRKYHEQQTPNRDILPNTTRPYRAFITSVNDVGRAVCELKFVPPINNNGT